MGRRIVSLSLFIAFLLLTVSSVVLYIAPEGRVAYWGNWRILFLTKSQWGQLHITGGAMLVVLSLWHLAYNWKLIVAYMGSKTKELGKMPAALLLALGLNWLVYAGTLMGIEPMQQVLAWNSDLKAYQAEALGNPPYGHAELSSVEQLCLYMQWDAKKAVAFLNTRGLTQEVKADTIINDIATQNRITPQQVYMLMQVSAGDGFVRLPPTPPEGTGKKTVEGLCKEYNLPLNEVLTRLENAELKIAPELSLRDIAQQNGKNPAEIYQIIRTGK